VKCPEISFNDYKVIKHGYVTGRAIQVVAATTYGETGTATTYIWPDILLATWNLPSSSAHQSAGYHTQLYGGRICYPHPYTAAGNLLLYLNFSDKPLLGKIRTNLKALKSQAHYHYSQQIWPQLQKQVYDGEDKCIQYLIQKTWGTRPLGGNKNK